jgi:hypothetical protein
MNNIKKHGQNSTGIDARGLFTLWGSPVAETMGEFARKMVGMKSLTKCNNAALFLSTLKDKPIFELEEKKSGRHFKIFADGRVKGFEKSYIIKNRIVPLYVYLKARASLPQ